MEDLKQYALTRLEEYRETEKAGGFVFDHYLSVYECGGVVTSRHHIQKGPAIRHAYDYDGICVCFSHTGEEMVMSVM